MCRILFFSLVCIAMLVPNADAQTSSVCPKQLLFGSPPRLFYSCLKCVKKADGTCSEQSVTVIEIFGSTQTVGCQADPDCDKCNSDLEGLKVLENAAKEEDSKYPPLAFKNVQLVPAAGTKIDFSGLAKVKNDEGKFVYYRYFDLSAPYEIDGVTKYLGASIAMQLDADPGNASDATVVPSKDESDMLKVKFQGRQTFDYAIVGKAIGKTVDGIIDSKLTKLTDTDSLKN